MSTSTCHLSSLEINHGDEVIVLPIKYSYLTETNQLVYGTNISCTLVSLPLLARYDDYGKVVLDESSEYCCSILREKINKGLMSNPEIKIKKDNSKFYFGDNFYVFKREEHNEPIKAEFLSDSKIISICNDSSFFYNFDEFKTNNELLNYINNNFVTQVFNNNVFRYGYLLIRKDIYDSAIKNIYSADSSRILLKINELFNLKVSKEDVVLEVNNSFLNVETLEIFNCDNNLSNAVIKDIRNIIVSDLDAPESFVYGLLNWALISKLYAELGKSFYPNVRRHSSMEPVYLFNSIVNDHIDIIKKQNIKNYQKENGKVEVPHRNIWSDWIRY